MKYLGYGLLGIIVFLMVEFLSIGIGSALGSGPYEIGLVVTAVSILCGIIVVCTSVIVKEIKNLK